MRSLLRFAACCLCLSACQSSIEPSASSSPTAASSDSGGELAQPTSTEAADETGHEDPGFTTQLDDPLGQWALAARSARRSSLVDECMAIAGFDQLAVARAFEVEQGLGLRIQHRSLDDPLVDFEPADPQAALNGYAVRVLPEVIVRANNDEFFSVLEGCRLEHPGEAMARASLSSLIDDAYNAYAMKYETGEFDELVEAWVECLDDAGYSNTIGEDADLTRLDLVFGIEFGSVVADVPIIEPEPLTEGEIRIEYPPEGLRYEPTQAEVALAQADQACKDSVGMIDFVVESHRQAVQEFVDEHGESIEELKATMESDL